MARQTKANVANLHVADICLYGIPRTGYGWSAQVNPELVVDSHSILGDGEPQDWRTLTECVWLALREIREKTGLTLGRVRIFEPSGRMVADAALGFSGYYGDLRWESAPVYTVSLDDLLAHATPAGGCR